MKKTYFAPQVKVVTINGSSILAGSGELTGGNKVGRGVQLSKESSLDFDDFESEE